MKTFKLVCPVYTFDYKQLLPGGKELTPEALDELIASNKEASYQSFPILKYGSIHQDLRRFLQEYPYNINFEKPDQAGALTLMSKIDFIPPLLKFFDYFKENDAYTYRHSLVVFALSILLAQDLLKETEDWIIDVMAGTIHDFGKVNVPLKILKKKDPLSSVDKIILEHHSMAGFVLLSYFLQDHGRFAAWAAKEHHERRDGSGYPLGIPMKDRMIEIISVCDIYDALLSPRPHRPTPYDNRTALEEITEMAEKGKIGWEVVQALVSYSRKDRPAFQECKVSIEKRGTPRADDLRRINDLRKMKCPNCHGTAREKKTSREGIEHMRYECRSCGNTFSEDDLLNMELDFS